MKKTFTILILLFAFCLNTEAYENIKSRIDILTKQGYSINNLRFGLHSLATTSLDKDLGENDAPPFKPPEGVIAAFVIFDSTQMENIWTYMDLRPYPKSPFDTVFHFLKVLKGNGDLCTLSWNPLFPEILSAVLVDALTGGKVVNINMKDSVKAFIDNEFIESFILKVVYDPILYIDENNFQNNEELSVYFNQCCESLTIDSKVGIDSYELYSISGLCFLKGNSNLNKETVIAMNIPNGAYIINVKDLNGKHILRKIVKT
jgi:hypothetical protein